MRRLVIQLKTCTLSSNISLTKDPTVTVMPANTDAHVLEKKTPRQQEALRRREGAGIKSKVERRRVVREPSKVRKSVQLDQVNWEHVEDFDLIPKCCACLVFFPSPSAMISHFRERPTHKVGEFKKDWA